MKEIVFTIPRFRNIHANASLLNDSNYIGEASIEGVSLGIVNGELHEVNIRELHDLDLCAAEGVGLLVRERLTTLDGQGEVWAYIP